MKISLQEERMVLKRRHKVAEEKKQNKKIDELNRKEEEDREHCQKIEKTAIGQVVAIILLALKSSRNIDVDHILEQVSEGVAKKSKVYQKHKSNVAKAISDSVATGQANDERAEMDRKDLDYFKTCTEEGRRMSNRSYAD